MRHQSRLLASLLAQDPTVHAATNCSRLLWVSLDALPGGCIAGSRCDSHKPGKPDASPAEAHTPRQAVGAEVSTPHTCTPMWRSTQQKKYSV